MSRGYKKLVADEFFGDVEQIDWDKVKLIDKINLEAKVGNLIDVPFNAEEKALFDKTMNTEEFSEVLDVVREILAYSKENQEDLMNPPKVPQNDEEFDGEENEDPTSMGHDDMENNNEEEENTRDEESSTNNETDEDTEQEDGEERITTNSNPQHTDEDISITDEIFRGMEKSLIPESTDSIFANDISKEKFDKAVVPYNKLKKLREEHFNYNYNTYKEDYWYTKTWDNGILTKEQEAEFGTYIKKVKKAVMPAVKEFEQRKAAKRWQHAQTAKTGRIDVNKLHAYKLSDDIFSRATHLADSKNHGMFMLVDYSGSMSGQLHNVLDQIIHSVYFCKAVNIPFEVYAFTTGGQSQFDYGDGDIHMDNLTMPQLIHSGLKKKDFEEAVKWLYARTDYARGSYADFIRPQVEDWGSTPLNQALIVSHKLIKSFKHKNQLENVTLLSVTDGDTNRLSIYEDRSLNVKRVESVNYYSTNVVITIDGKRVKMKDRGKAGTESLYNNLKTRYGINTMGFFVADGSKELNHRIMDAYHSKTGDADWYDGDFQAFRKNKIKENTKNRCIEFLNVLGYDHYYIVRSDKFGTEEEECFDISDDATDSQIRTAFKRFSNKKKTNKNLMTKFGKAVAV